ncbi:MAG: hypothetical protein JNK02_17865 [Planctomycetes bacterium]|nr:hypothetical protein [Planctomycetota bacterium]
MRLHEACSAVLEPRFRAAPARLAFERRPDEPRSAACQTQIAEILGLPIETVDA